MPSVLSIEHNCARDILYVLFFVIHQRPKVCHFWATFAHRIFGRSTVIDPINISPHPRHFHVRPLVVRVVSMLFVNNRCRATAFFFVIEVHQDGNDLGGVPSSRMKEIVVWVVLNKKQCSQREDKRFITCKQERECLCLPCECVGPDCLLGLSLFLRLLRT